MLPAGLVLVSRGLVNAAVDALRASASDLQPLLLWLLAGFVLALIEALNPLANKFFIQCLSDDLHLTITSDVLRHATRLDTASLEDPRRRDILDQAQEDAAGALWKLVAGLQTVSVDVSQVALLVAIVMYLEPLVLVVICPFALPYLIFRWCAAKQRYSEDTSWTTKRRWTRYFVSHLTGQQSAVETKLLGLGPLFLANFNSFMSQFRDRRRTYYRQEFASSSVFAVLTIIGSYLVFIRVALQVVRCMLTVGDIVVFAGVSARLRLTLERLVTTVSEVMEQAMYVGNLRNFLHTLPRLTDSGSASWVPCGGSVRRAQGSR
jgi:ATP-binding cassette, subfamily B, bacterial